MMKMLPKLKKTGSVFLASFLLVLSLSVPALALPSINQSLPGSVTINMSGTASSGIKFTLYKVAALTGNPGYTLTSDFVASKQQLEQLSTAPASTVADTAKQLETYASTNNVSGIPLSTDANGSVKFSGLALGYYLIVPDSDPTSPASFCDPFLCSVPMQSADGSSWIYDITADTKCESPAGAVILKKANPSGTSLSGAVFRLEKKNYYTGTISLPVGTPTGSDGSGTYFWSVWVSSLTTSISGQIAIKGMPFGQYRFIEQTAPSGYVLNTTPHEFTISTAGSVTLVSGSYVPASGSVQTITVTNYTPPSSHHDSSTPPSSSSSSTPDSSPSSTPTSSLPDNSIPKSPPTESIPDENVPKSGFDLPKTGGSIAYGLCTYGGIFLAAFGAVIFILSRKKNV
jgi:uncharacterized surface anchored protein